MNKNFIDYGIDLGGKSGEEVKTICPQCSPTRKKKNYPCLNVNTLRGVWNCWHCGWSGALKTGEFSKPKVAHTKAYYKPDFKSVPLSDGALKFFQTRGITTEVLLRNQITITNIWMPQVEEEVSAIAFPYFRNHEVVNIKYRDKSKNFRQVGGAQKTFYKIDDVEDTAIIVEGEMDALSLEVAGFKYAISVPDGAPTPTAKNFETKFEFLEEEKLEKATKIYIAVDSDEPGRRLEEELARRLGKERCYKVTWPDDCKDANEVLLKHGTEIISDCLANALAYPVDGVFSVSDIEDNLDQILMGGMPIGDSTGWENLDEFYKPCPGQWTLVTGIPSMGKSEWLDALAINLAEQSGWVFGVCSPENQPIDWHAAKLIEKRIEKRLKAGSVNSDEFTHAKAWLNQHFHFIMPEQPTLESVLDKAKILVRKYGMKGMIIDPYNELDHTRRREGINETEYISTFLTQLRTFARDHGVHIWLVAHPAKMMKEKDGHYPVPDGYSISGSAHFYNKADNIVVVHRDQSRPDTPSEVHVQKVRSRWLGKRGTAYLWWRSTCGRYDIRPTPTYMTDRP